MKMTKKELADQWAKTAEANVILQDRINSLERAIKEAAAMGEITTCYTCTRNIVDDELCDECDRIGTHWRFDYERFSREDNV